MDPVVRPLRHRCLADRPLIVDVHGDAAYTVSTYTEILVSREDGFGASERVVGRLVLFLRRDPGGEWLVTLAMNSHVRPVESVEPVQGRGQRLTPPNGNPEDPQRG